jgi:hypothetical protein
MLIDIYLVLYKWGLVYCIFLVPEFGTKIDHLRTEKKHLQNVADIISE